MGRNSDQEFHSNILQFSPSPAKTRFTDKLPACLFFRFSPPMPVQNIKITLSKIQKCVKTGIELNSVEEN